MNNHPGFSDVPQTPISPHTRPSVYAPAVGQPTPQPRALKMRHMWPTSDDIIFQQVRYMPVTITAPAPAPPVALNPPPPSSAPPTRPNHRKSRFSRLMSKWRMVFSQTTRVSGDDGHPSPLFQTPSNTQHSSTQLPSRSVHASGMGSEGRTRCQRLSCILKSVVHQVIGRK